jgi:hypothetical protein
MTHQEVETLIGPPLLTMDWGKVLAEYWESNDVGVWVLFDSVDGQVLEKHMHRRSSGWLDRLQNLWKRASGFLADGKVSLRLGVVWLQRATFGWKVVLEGKALPRRYLSIRPQALGS